MEIHTWPTRRSDVIRRFLESFQRLLLFFEDRGWLPIGYEMNVHLSLGISLKDLKGWLTRSWTIDDAHSVYLHFQKEIQNYFLLLTLPLINQARLEHLLHYRRGPWLALKLDHLPGKRVTGRCHLRVCELSTTLDINYLISVCREISWWLDESRTSSDRSWFKRWFEQSYERLQALYLAQEGIRRVAGYRVGTELTLSPLLKLPLRTYHEQMWRLQRAIVRTLGKRARHRP